MQRRSPKLLSDSVDLASGQETVPLEDALPNWLLWAEGVVLAILIALLYRQILAALVGQWLHDPNYSHGFFAAPFCAWMVWKTRSRLAALPVQPSWLGLVVIVGALGLLILGVFGAENFVARASLLFLLAGLTIYFAGWRIFYAVLFPWAVLFLMIPLPAIVFNQATLPLQLEASSLASNLLMLCGIPVLREGNVIQLPSLALDVAEACSGLRSLMSLITLAVMYGYLFERRISRRALLILSAIPIAIVANGLRIVGSGLLGQYWGQDKAEGFFHLFSGLLIFLASFSSLLVFHAMLSWLGHRVQARQV